MFAKYRCKRNGKIDGKKGIPRVDQISISQFEEERVAEANKIVRNIEGKNIRYETKLSYAKNRKKTYEDELKKFDEEHNYPKCKEDFATIKNEYYAISKIVCLPIWLWLVLVGIAISDFPLNARAFLIFGSDKTYENIIMALTICLGIPVAAHWYGKYLKDTQKEKQIDKLGIIIKWNLSFLICVFLGISFLRGVYYGVTVSAMELNEIALNISIMVILFIINIFTFLLASLTAYHAYNLHPNNSEEMKAEKRRLKKVINDYKNKKIEKQRNWIKKRIDKFLGDIDTHGPKIKAVCELQREMREIMHHYNKLIAIYRKENIRVREETESEPVSYQRKLVFNNTNNEIIVSEYKEVGYTKTSSYEDVSRERIVDNEQNVTNPNGKH